MRLTFLISLFILAAAINPMDVAAQSTLDGVIIDSKTRKAIPFTTVIPDDRVTEGCTADLDGKFELKLSQPTKTLRLSCVGYETQRIDVKSLSDPIVIRLKPRGVDLAEVVIMPGENPAHRIVKRAISNRKLNNPEKACNFQYKSYSKFIVTLALDTAIENHPEKLADLDTNRRSMYSFAERQHLFLMESVTERQHMPPSRDHEKVLASRVSGFQAPGFAALATQFQSFTAYDDEIRLGDISYSSPLAAGSTRRYLFLLEDTLYQGNDSVFVLSYRPRKGKEFPALKGQLHIHTNGYALQNITAEPNNPNAALAISIKQHYEMIDNRQWFPVQLDTKFGLNSITMSTEGGETIYAVGRSYLEDIVIDPPLRKRDFTNIALSYDTDAERDAENVLALHRRDSLSRQEANTYVSIDSLGKKYHFDRRLRWMTKLIGGKFPIGPVDIDLDRFLYYNAYEGLRMGLGAHTNEKVSKYASIGGYGAYGTRDKALKYGADFRIHPWPGTPTRLEVAYENDVTPTARARFLKHIDTYDVLRDYYVNQMDQVEKWEARLRFRALRHFEWNFFANQQTRIFAENFEYNQALDEGISVTRPSLFLVETGVEARIAIGEKFLSSPVGQFSLGAKAPIVRVRLARGWDDLADGELDYWRCDVSSSHRFRLGLAGSMHVRVDLGLTEGDVPVSMLHYASGSNLKFDADVPAGFAVMVADEFLADRIAQFFWQYNWPRPIINHKRYKPQPALMFRALLGEMSRTPITDIAYDVPDQGYYEAGVAVNRLIDFGSAGVGIAGYYRFGPYHQPEITDNIGVKLTLYTPISF